MRDAISHMEIPVYKTEGIIIKKTDLAEIDRFLTIYTKDLGKILIRAKGIGKKESKLKSLIEPFNLCEFLLARSKTIDVLTNVYPIKEFDFLHSNLTSLAYAFYFAELIDKLVVAPERDDKIWALLKRAMEVLDKPNSVIPRPKAEESPANAGGEVPQTREIPRGVYTERNECARNDGLNRIKILFEQKLLEFLGHGLPPHQNGVGGIPKNKTAPEVIQGLVDGPILSEKFLKAL